MGYWFLMLIAVLVIYAIYVYNNSDTLFSQESTRMAFENSLAAGEVTSVRIVQEKEIPSGYVVYAVNGDSNQLFYVSDVNEVQEYLTGLGVPYMLSNVQRDSYFMTTIFPVLLIIVALAIMFMMFSSALMGMGGGQGNNKMLNFGKSRARRMTEKDKKITFADVAGLDEEKEELWEIVDFLKEPAKYNQLGARIPKGVLLEGPPGTGKTLLAKAVAGEAGVQFFFISGSDFMEMFVGVGASRVRDLFAEAKQNAPCIIFIDEIDAVARRRGTGMGGGHDEREQTLNQMLVEMDGFGANEGIIVMAATNRVDILDPAIMRPGRFDRKVLVGRPDVKGREEILKVHSKNKPLGDDVDLERIARTTAGYTGADLENLLNESAIAAAKAGRKFIRETDVEAAFVKASIGTEKHSRVISDEEKRITAYHESGHAILFHVLPLMERVHTISIIPTGAGAAGYTMPLPEKDRMFMTRGKILQHIMVCLGGRIAEELIFEDVTTGASQDIKDATNAARTMVTKYGMSESLGLINYGSDDEEVFIGRDLAHTRSYSERTAAEIDEEVKKIVTECYRQAKELIMAHEDVLHRSAALLLEKEKITTEEFEALFGEA
jgi:cell division protease FtsH